MDGLATAFAPVFRPASGASASLARDFRPPSTLNGSVPVPRGGSVTISSEGRMKSLLNSARLDFRQTSINITVTARRQENGDPLLSVDDQKLELILRLLARDAKDYQRMKASFKSFIAESNQALSRQAQTQEQPGPALQQQSLTFQFAFSITEARLETTETQQAPMQTSDPLVLDLGGKGIELTRAGQGALFDINADGKVESTAWVTGSSAFLALDKNNNGQIDDGSELFGDQNGATQGFEELARYDANRDHKIDRLDPVFTALKAYQDVDTNGKFDRGEMSTLEQVGIQSINLDVTASDDSSNGNRIILKGSFTTTEGTRGEIGDALLGYTA